MFFGNALKSSLFNAMATHPPLEERIRAIDSNWDGKFPDPALAKAEDPETDPGPRARPRSAFPPIIPGFPAGASGLATAATTIQAASILPNLGNPTPLHLRYAVELRESLPENVRAAARDPKGATALLYTLLLSDDESTRATQLAELARRVVPAIHDQTVALSSEVSPLAERARLPLVNLALPALRQMRADEFQKFNDTLVWLIESDEQIILFEFVLQKIIQRQLEPHFTRARPAPTQYYTLKPLAPDCAVLLSALAHTGQTEPAEIAKAFESGATYVRAAGVSLTLRSREECRLIEINNSLDRLAQAVPQIKKNLLAACVQVVGADGVIQESEAELLRGIAETLDCPMPPFLKLA